MKKALFGCGKYGMRALNKYGRELIDCFIDNHKEGSVDGIPVISLGEFKNKEYESEIVICTLRYCHVIEEQLKREGIQYSIFEDILKECVPDYPPNIAHGKWIDYLVELCDRPGNKVLEIGSRVVTGANFRDKFKNAEYIGFDYYPGENVDVVGDAHILSTYFPNTKFDLIFSSAVFEHLAMPWQVAQEINSLLSIGGFVFVETHYSFSAHERPWHFFQFSDYALKVLFSQAMGIETIESGASNPIWGGIFQIRQPVICEGVRFHFCFLTVSF